MTARAHHGRAIAVALLAGGLMAACESERSTVFTPVGDPSFDFVVAGGVAKLPAGSANREYVRTLVQTLEIDTNWVAPPDSGFGPIDVTVLPRASGNTEDTLAVDSAATLMARALRSISGGVYQVWNVGPDGLATPVYGRVVEYNKYFTGDFDPVGDSIFAADSVVVAPSGAGTYVGSDDPIVDSVAFEILAEDPATTINPFSNSETNGLFLTIEAAEATTPSEVKFLWRRVGIASGGFTSNVTVIADTVILSTNTDSLVPDTIEVTRRARSTLTGSGELAFGNYGGLDASSASSRNDYVFGARGAGLGGARGGELSVDLTEVARPPVGFFYRGWVVDRYGVGVVVDTVRSPWSRDSSVSRVSLYDADINDLLPNVVGGEIRAIQIRNCASGSAVGGCQNSMNVPMTNPFLGLASFVLKLEPKGAGAPGPEKSVSHVGVLPDIVIK